MNITTLEQVRRSESASRRSGQRSVSRMALLLLGQRGVVALSHSEG
jgi:hypothetical protein